MVERKRACGSCRNVFTFYQAKTLSYAQEGVSVALHVDFGHVRAFVPSLRFISDSIFME
ncbi:hypothetical protein ACU8NW_34910 (plasmid) [Rhizobium leguminosarum]